MLYRTHPAGEADCVGWPQTGRGWPRRRHGLPWACCLVLSLAVVRPGQAETLLEALAQAYRSNPVLLAAQAQLRAADEGVPQALSGWRPSLIVTPGTGKRYEDSTLTYSARETNLTPWHVQTTLRQNLYKGGQVLAAVDRAEATVRARRAQLFATEQTVLFDAGAAYVDVVRDTAILELNENNARVLERQLTATRARFTVGEVTRTDVAQAESRLSQAIADRVAAEGRLAKSRAAYQHVIGARPGALSPAGPLGRLPGTLDELIAAARVDSPDVIAARFEERAAAATIDETRGKFLPSLDLEASVGRREATSFTEKRHFSAEIGARLTIPLYQQGTVSSQLREAKHLYRQRVRELEAVERAAVQQATQAWENLTTARAQIEAFGAEIQAAEIALDGVAQEEQVGSRTILDVLDAEQELLDARSNLVVATRNEVVASLELRQAVGTLTARALVLPVEAYDPEANYRKVRGKWWGVSIADE